MSIGITGSADSAGRLGTTASGRATAPFVNRFHVLFRPRQITPSTAGQAETPHQPAIDDDLQNWMSAITSLTSERPPFPGERHRHTARATGATTVTADAIRGRVVGDGVPATVGDTPSL